MDLFLFASFRFNLERSEEVPPIIPPQKPCIAHPGCVKILKAPR